MRRISYKKRRFRKSKFASGSRRTEEVVEKKNERKPLLSFKTTTSPTKLPREKVEEETSSRLLTEEEVPPPIISSLASPPTATPPEKKEEGTPLANLTEEEVPSPITPTLTGPPTEPPSEIEEEEISSAFLTEEGAQPSSPPTSLPEDKEEKEEELAMSGSEDENKQNKAIIDQIYETLKNLFGPNSNQALVMEFPGRVLDESTFHFENDHSIYSNVLKPQVVTENEFRLTDSIFDINLNEGDHGYIVGGPSGRKVSLEYELVLSTMIPRFDDFESLFRDRQTMRKWLLEKIEDDVDGETFHGSRMQFYEKLTKRYEEARSDWESKRIERFKTAKSAKDSREALDQYAKWMAFNAEPIEANIAALFNDLVVRGHYHEIKRIIGYIDVSSPTEILDDCKANMRQSSMLSLDESEMIYPVVMEPASWSKSLSTDFEPVDLLLSPDSVEEDLMNKLSKKAQLETEIQYQTKEQTGSITDLQKKIKKAQTDQDDATKKMLQNYTEATFTAIQIAYKAYCRKNGKNPSSNDTITALTKKDLGDAGKVSNGQVLTEKDIENFKNFQKANIANQTLLDGANRELAFELEEKAKAESTDSKAAVVILQGQLEQLNLEINRLQKIALANGTTDTKRLHPINKPVGEFFDVKIISDGKSTETNSELISSSSFSKTSVNFLFGSYGNSSDKEFSEFSRKYTASNTHIEIGFRATKVTIDRGGWLNPDVLQTSNNMYSTNKNGKFTETFNAYPVAFVVAKDVTLRYKFAAEDLEKGSKYAHEARESSGGFLCFSTSNGSSSTQNSGSDSQGSKDDAVVIRIPGPQILMWILEKVPEDKSVPYPDGPSVIPKGVVDLLKTKEEDN